MLNVSLDTASAARAIAGHASVDLIPPDVGVR